MSSFPTVGVVGLGLIGGSFAYALKKAGHRVIGFARDNSKALFAQLEGAIDEVGAPEKSLRECDLVILALPPHAILAFLAEHAADFAPDAVVIDIAGVKRVICDSAWKIAREHGFVFLGGHPMAGKEKSGFKNATPTLFSGASMILTFAETPKLEFLAELKAFFLGLGFGKVVLTHPDEHDRIIAHTSQLAHILSAAYVRNPAALDHAGFAAGSFRDMIRVGAMDASLWSELFLDNADHLTGEIDRLIGNLQLFRDAIKAGNREELMNLIRESAEIKSRIDAQRAVKPETALKK